MAAGKVVANKQDDVLQVHVSGYVGENAGLFDLNFSGVKKIVVDLSGVNYINSVGVKNWINWTGRFPKGLITEFHNCPTLIVNQVNMVAGFIPDTGTVESLLAPFICEDCGVEQAVTLKRGVDYQYAKEAGGVYTYQPPKIPCPKCQKPMELDAMELKFFHFLKAMR